MTILLRKQNVCFFASSLTEAAFRIITSKPCSLQRKWEKKESIDQIVITSQALKFDKQEDTKYTLQITNRPQVSMEFQLEVHHKWFPKEADKCRRSEFHHYILTDHEY